MAIPRWADRASGEIAIVGALRSWTAAELTAAIETRLARWKGATSLALVGAPTVEHVLDLLAAIEGGLPAAMLHPRWTERETVAIVERVRPSLVIDGGRVLRERANGRSLDGALAVVATSGTSGVPKLAILSRRAFDASARASAAHLGASDDDRWLLAMPLAHVGGLGVVVRSLVQRAPIVIHEGSGDWMPLAKAARVTHVSLVPTSLARMLERADALPSSVRVVLVGGAACPRALLARALANGIPIHPTYGLTETCGQVATATSDPRQLVPLPGVALRIVNGSICVRTPARMDGWLDAESPFDAEGFYDTGDLGEIIGGALRIHARRTDLVVSGGENVYPREVEDALERIDGIRSACVFGVPDPEWGQRVAAAIVVDERAPDDDAIRTRLRDELASFKLPRLLARLDALETNATGKIDRARTAARATPLLRAV